MISQAIALFTSIIKYAFTIFSGNSQEAAGNIAKDATTLLDTMDIEKMSVTHFIETKISGIPIIGVVAKVFLISLSLLMWIPKLIVKIIKHLAGMRANKNYVLMSEYLGK